MALLTTDHTIVSATFTHRQNDPSYPCYPAAEHYCTVPSTHFLSSWGWVGDRTSDYSNLHDFTYPLKCQQLNYHHRNFIYKRSWQNATMTCNEQLVTHTHTHTHTHPFNGPMSGTTRVSRYQEGKTNLDFTGARDSEWQWHQLGHIQVCTSLQTDNHANTSPLTFFTGQMPFLPPNQQRQSTEGTTSQFRKLLRSVSERERERVTTRS